MEFVDQKTKPKGFLDAAEVYEPEYTRPENLDAEAVLDGDENFEAGRARIASQASENFKENAVEAIQSEADVEETTASIRDGEELLFGVYNSDDIYLEDDVIGRSKGYTAAEQKFYRNLQILSEEMEVAALEQEDKGWIGYGIDFVDRELFRATIFGGYEGLTNRTAREGSRVFGQLTGTASASEMRAFAKEYVEDIRSEGFLKGENVFALNQMQREVYGMGYNPEAKMDAFFGVLDAASLVGGVGKIAKVSKLRVLKSTTAATRAGALGGVEEATEVAAKVHAKDIDPLNTANMQASAVDLNKGFVRPTLAESEKLRAESKILSVVLPAEARGAVPTAARMVDFDLLKAGAAKAFAKKFKANIVDVDVADLTEQTKAVRFSIGTFEGGKPFKLVKGEEVPEAAQDLADRIGGEVVPVNPDVPSQGFVVKVEEALDMSKGLKSGFDFRLAQLKWHQLLGKAFDNGFVGSTAARDVDELNSLALRSEDAAKFIQNEGLKHKKKIDSLSFEDNSMLDKIFTDLRDGPDSVLRREWSLEEVKGRWKSLTGETMSDKVVEAYNAAKALDEAAYYFTASEIMKKYIQKGFKNTVTMNDGIARPAKRVKLSKLNKGDKVFDARNNVKLYAEEIDDLPSNTVVWQLNKEANGQQYVLFPDNVEVINFRDVLGYSAYGRRTNPDGNYFAFIKGSKGVKTILSAFSDASARTAAKELKAIQDVYRVGGVTDEAVEAVLMKNRKFNPALSTRAELEKWLADNNIDLLDGDIMTKRRDEPIGDPFDKVFGDSDSGSFVQASYSRSDTVIPQFGGGGSFNPSPLDSISDQFGSASHQYATSVYTQRSMQGWVEQARQLKKDGYNIGVEVGEGSDFRTVFLNAQVTGTSPEAARMRELQSIIKRRHGMRTPLEESMSGLMDTLSEQFYDVSGLKLQLKGPQATLLKVGFFSAFAFNLSQVFLQSSQVITTSALVGFDVAKRSLAGSTMMRSLLHNTDDLAVRELGFSRLAGVMGISEKDVKELVELFYQKLPNIPMGDVAELGTGTATGMSRNAGLSKTSFTAKKVGAAMWDAGLKPFNFGESTAKTNAFVAAALEFKKKFPDSSLLSEAGRKAVAARTEVLTNNMSTTSKSALQSGIGAVPTQWLNYFFRTMEQVFVGRDLTKVERAKLGFYLMPFYGFTGLGMGHLADTVAESFDMDPNDDTDRGLYLTMKYGVLDGFLNHFTPFEAALAPRMAPFPAIFDMYDKFTEENVLTAIGGPSGSIAVTGLDALFSLGSNVVNGTTSTLTEDSLRVLKNFSGFNNIAKGIGILRDDVYRNRKGLVVPVEVDLTDALMSFGGFAPLTVTEYYGMLNRTFDLSKGTKALQKDLFDKSNLAWSLYTKDPERARDIIQDGITLVSKSPLTEQKKRELLNILNPQADRTGSIIRTLYENQKESDLNWFLSIQEKD